MAGVKKASHHQLATYRQGRDIGVRDITKSVKNNSAYLPAQEEIDADDGRGSGREHRQQHRQNSEAVQVVEMLGPHGSFGVMHGNKHDGKRQDAADEGSDARLHIPGTGHDGTGEVPDLCGVGTRLQPPSKFTYGLPDVTKICMICTLPRRARKRPSRLPSANAIHSPSSAIMVPKGRAMDD